MKALFHTSINHRAYAVPFILGGLLVLSLLIMGAINIRISELQVPVRYSSFGITNFYREQWFYQLSFMLFGVIIFVTNSLLALKLSEKKGQAYGVAFQWLTVGLLVITLITVAAIFQVADLV